MSAVALLFMMTAASPTSLELATRAFAEAKYDEAAVQYGNVLNQMERGAIERTAEQDVRERLGLSHYLAHHVDASRAEFRALCSRFPKYAPDKDALTPDAVAFIYEVSECSPKASLSKEPKPQEVIPWRSTGEDSPKEPAAFRWYYLAPLGIGQYAAGSPVRGTIFLTTQLGFLALNIAGAVLLANQRVPGGFVQDVSSAQNAQVMINVGFFGLLSSLIVGTLDGALWEP